MSFPPIPFDSRDCSWATWSHRQPFHRQQSWNSSLASNLHLPLSLSWVGGVPQGTTPCQAAAGHQVSKQTSYTCVGRCWKAVFFLPGAETGAWGILTVPRGFWSQAPHFCIRKHLENCLKNQLVRLGSWLTFGTPVPCHKWGCSSPFLGVGEAMPADFRGFLRIPRGFCLCLNSKRQLHRVCFKWSEQREGEGPGRQSPES